MANANEEDEVCNIDSPVNRSGETSDAKPFPVLVNIGVSGPEDDRNQRKEGEIEGSSRSLNRLEKDGKIGRAHV